MAREMVLNTIDLDPGLVKNMILNLAKIFLEDFKSDDNFSIEADFFGSDKKCDSYRFIGQAEFKELLDNPDEISIDGYESATITAYHRKEKKDE